MEPSYPATEPSYPATEPYRLEQPLLGGIAADQAPKRASTGRIVVVVAALVILTTADSVLVTILFDQWDEKYSLFLNQGTAFVYIIASLSVLGVRALWRRRQRTAASTPTPTRLEPVTLPASTAGSPQPRTPWYVLVAIGLFNGSANFFMAIAQPHTPGLTQSILSLLGTPLVLLFVFVFLRKSPSGIAAAGALLIVAGTAVSALRAVPGVMHTSKPAPVKAEWWAVVSFAGAQLFLAGEKVFEEYAFSRWAALDALVMFAWTLTTQFILGWALLPVQTVPALGDVHLSDIPQLVADGTRCTLGADVGGCGGDAAYAVLFWVYCAVDFNCYLFGLWAIQQHGASLMVLASAIALPLQQLVLCARPIVGRWVEVFFWGDALALGLVCTGLFVYLGFSPEGKAERGIKPHP